MTLIRVIIRSWSSSWGHHQEPDSPSWVHHTPWTFTSIIPVWRIIHISPRLVKSKGFSLDCCRSSQNVHQGSDIWKPEGPSVLPDTLLFIYLFLFVVNFVILLFTENWSLAVAHHSEASSRSSELPPEKAEPSWCVFKFPALHFDFCLLLSS